MDLTIFNIANIANIIVRIAYLVFIFFSIYLFFRFYNTLKHTRIACQLYVVQNLQLKEKAKQIYEESEDMSVDEIANMLGVDIIIVKHWLEEN